MRILFLANRVPFPIRDGQARRTYHILKGLAQAHDVHLLSLYENAEEGSVETGRHLRTFCRRVDILPGPSKRPGLAMGARLVRSLFSRDPYTVWRHYSSEYAARVRAALASTEYDVVHCDILPIAYAIRNVRTPFCALTDHDVSYLKARRLAAQTRNPAAKAFISYEAVKLQRLERSLCQEADLVIAVSDVDRAALERLCPVGRFAVVENGVDVTAFSPDPAALEPDTVVWVGGFHHQPNFEAVRYFLEHVYPAVKRARVRAKAYIVGGDVSPRLTRLTGGDASVVFTGYVDDPAPYIQRGAVFIAPILSGSGTKLKLLEAMSAGKAIVSTSIGVEGIEGRDGEHYLVADDPAAFSRKVAGLLGDDALRQELGANARALAEQKYDWRAICDKMSRIYEEAVRTGAGRRRANAIGEA